MIYKISKNNSFTKILGKDFVNTNRNKGFINIFIIIKKYQ